MIHLLKCILLVSVLYGTGATHDGPNKQVSCQDLGLSFLLPDGFRTLDSAQLNALSQRGEKAVRESFQKEIVKGWQQGCINLQDSFKRSVLITTITVQEAIELNGSVDAFIDNMFKDGNDFIIQRFKRRIPIEIDEDKTIKQSRITIAGMKVRKNAFTLTTGSGLLFYSRYYFFEKQGKLYLLSFTGNPKASDNEAIEAAIENAKKI